MKTLGVCNIQCLAGGFWENASYVIKFFITFTVVQLLKKKMSKSCDALKMSKNENWKEKSSSCELWSLGCWELPEAWHADMPEKALFLLDGSCIVCIGKEQGRDLSWDLSNEHSVWTASDWAVRVFLGAFCSCPSSHLIVLTYNLHKMPPSTPHSNQKNKIMGSQDF